MPVIQKDISLTAANTLSLESCADYFYELTDENDLPELLRQANELSLHWLVLGGGSNVVLPESFHGLVIKNSLKGIGFQKEGDDVLVTAAAGENWHNLVQVCLAKGYNGLENLSLIPGSVGAAPIQNIGAYGVELVDRFESLRGWHCDKQQFVELNSSDCEFAYRDSVFKHGLKGRFIITSVTLRLKTAAVVNTNYQALNDALMAKGTSSPTPQQVADTVIEIRQSELPDPAELPNAGSFFKNPIVPISLLQQLQQQYPEIVSYPVDEDSVKLAAGWLLEKAGWKGRRIAAVGMHDRQSLVLINYDHASASDVINLAAEIQKDIKQCFDVELDVEPVII